MNWTRYRRIAALAVSVISSLWLVWGLLPADIQTHELLFTPDELRALVIVEPLQLNGGIPETFSEAHHLALTSPKTLRVKDTAQVKLIFEPLPDGLLAGQEIDEDLEKAGDSAVNGDQAAYGVYTNAQLEWVGMHVLPAGVVSQPLKPGQTLTFTWQVDAGSPGAYTGTMWMSLRLVPLGSGEGITRTLSAQRFDVRVSNFLGLDGRTARWAGYLGMGLLIVLCKEDLDRFARRLKGRT
jgi:hypothetical protein